MKKITVFTSALLGISSVFFLNQNSNKIIDNQIIINENIQTRGTDGYPTTGNVPPNMQYPTSSWWWFKYIPEDYISETDLANALFSGTNKDPNSFSYNFFNSIDGVKIREISSNDAKKYAKNVKRFYGLDKTQNPNLPGTNHTEEFYTRFYFKEVSKSQKEGWIKIDLVNYKTHSEHWTSNQKGRLGGNPFVYKTFVLKTPKWDEDGDGKLEDKNTNSFIEKNVIGDISSILPSEINETNYNNYINLKLIDFPSNSFIQRIVFKPNNEEKTLEIVPIFNYFFQNGKSIAQNVENSLEKFKLIIPGFSIDEDDDGRADVGNSEWTPQQMAVELGKNILPSQLSTNPNDENFVGLFINLNEKNIAKGTTYSYKISNQRDQEGLISVSVFVDQYFENSKLIK
ncbi:MAG: hypothetical protein ACRCRZ_02425 [Metamycoplasmataceae bacterium]